MSKVDEQLAELDSFEKAIIFALGTLEELSDKGYVERTEGSREISKGGMKLFHRMKETNYKPDKEELQTAVALFKQWQANELAKQ